MKKSFLYLLLIFFAFNSHSKSENNYKLITLFELNSGKKKNFTDVNDMKYEYFKPSKLSENSSFLDQRLIRIYNDSKLEIDKRSHFIKEKIDLKIKFKDIDFCKNSKEQLINIFALKSKDDFLKYLNLNYNNLFKNNTPLDDKIRTSLFSKIKLNFEKYFENLYQIKNNEYYFPLKFVLKNYYRSLYHGFVVVDWKKCIDTISPKHYEFFEESWYNNLNKDQIYNKILGYYKNNQILNINKKKYYFDELIIKGQNFNSVSSNKNFFVTEISNNDIKLISEKGINSLNFTWSPWIQYNGNILVDKDFKKVDIKNFKLERQISIFFYIKFILLIFIPISFLYIYKSKKFPIKIKNFYFIFNFFTFLILLVTLFEILSEEKFIYLTLLMLILFSYFLVLYEKSKD